MAPIVDGLIPEYESLVAIRKYNLAESQTGAAIADNFKVEYVPTFVFVDAQGKVTATIVGETSADNLRHELNKLK